MTINERFEEIIEVLFGGNKRAFAKAVGINPTVVENVVGARKGKPSYDVLVKVCANANISAEWLLFGSEKNLITDVFNIRKDLTLSVAPEDVAEEGGMPLKTVFTKGKKTIPKQSVSIGEAVHKVPKGSSEGIPLIPLDAVAGFPAESGGGVRLEDCERYVIPEFENKGANFLIRVSGDSMVPLYYSGDLLACRKITDIRFFQWGTVYVLETSQGVLVKRVQESVDHADSILCVSENSSVHHPFLLPRDDIRSLSIIVGLVRLV